MLFTIEYVKLFESPITNMLHAISPCARQRLRASCQLLKKALSSYERAYNLSDILTVYPTMAHLFVCGRRSETRTMWSGVVYRLQTK